MFSSVISVGFDNHLRNSTLFKMSLFSQVRMIPLGLAATKKHHAVVNALVKKMNEDKNFTPSIYCRIREAYHMKDIRQHKQSKKEEIDSQSEIR